MADKCNVPQGQANNQAATKAVKQASMAGMKIKRATPTGGDQPKRASMGGMKVTKADPTTDTGSTTTVDSSVPTQQKGSLPNVGLQSYMANPEKSKVASYNDKGYYEARQQIAKVGAGVEEVNTKVWQMVYDAHINGTDATFSMISNSIAAKYIGKANKYVQNMIGSEMAMYAITDKAKLPKQNKPGAVYITVKEKGKQDKIVFNPDFVNHPVFDSYTETLVNRAAADEVVMPPFKETASVDPKQTSEYTSGQNLHTQEGDIYKYNEIVDGGEVMAAMNGMGKVAWQQVYTPEQFRDMAREASNKSDADGKMEIEVKKRFKINVKEYDEHQTQKKITNQAIYTETAYQTALAVGTRGFYTPIKSDFRRRLYPHQPHLNIQGMDHNKANLEFVGSEHLTPDGEKYMRVHIANLFGQDKLTHAGREQWFNENIDRLLKMDQKDVLKEADEPWQAVSALKAWDKHLKGEPVHMPVFMDATSSGFQFVGTIMGDLELMYDTNVIDRRGKDGALVDERADLYTSFLDKVKSDVDSDYLVRSMFKKPSMRTIYGSADKGIKENINVEYGMSIANKDGISALTPDKILEESANINKIFNKFQSILSTDYKAINGIKKILQDAVKAGGYKEQYSWTMPNGEVIVFRPINKADIRKSVESSLGKATNSPSLEGYGHIPEHNLPMTSVNRFKKPTAGEHAEIAILANFVQSIDAYIVSYVGARMTHPQDGVFKDFASIHDSFGSHPNNMQKVKDLYNEAMQELVRTNFFENAVLEISGGAVKVDSYKEFNRLTPEQVDAMKTAKYSIT